MSYSPLMEDSSGRPLSPKNPVKTGLSKISSFISSNLSGKDEYTIAIQKLCSETTTESPKRKHIYYLNQKLLENPYNMELILLRFMGIIDWRGSENLALRSLLCIHTLLTLQEYNEVGNKVYYSFLLIYLNEVKDFYKNHFNSLLFEYALALIQRSILITKYSELYTFAGKNKFNTDPMVYRKFSPDEVLSFTSSYMSLIEKYQSVLRLSQSASQRSGTGGFYYNVVHEMQLVSSEVNSLADTLSHFIREYKQYLITLDGNKETKTSNVSSGDFTSHASSNPPPANTTADLLFFDDFFSSSVPSSSTTTSTPSTTPNLFNDDPFAWNVSSSSTSFASSTPAPSSSSNFPLSLSNPSFSDDTKSSSSNYSYTIATLSALGEQLSQQQKNFKAY